MKINEDYPRHQLARAIDGFLREKEASGSSEYRKVRQWIDVVTGMTDGSLSIGERKPTQFPVWVTLEVARGGFTTGRAAAETLRRDETALLRQTLLRQAGNGSCADRRTARAAIFNHLVSDAGIAEMRKILSERRFCVEVPEDAALLVFTWLWDHGEHDAALSIL
ncbi:MAG: hypothetical protein LBB55_07640, partial [Zoogloeaceae bacterium]|nr:hypothetical protein [Zoogloeaceae bacterium]